MKFNFNEQFFPLLGLYFKVVLTNLIFTEDPGPEIEPNIEKTPEVKIEPESDYAEGAVETPQDDVEIKKEEELEVKDEIETFEHNIEEDIKRGIKRRASSAFSDVDDEEFKGFDAIKLEVQANVYSHILGM